MKGRNSLEELLRQHDTLTLFAEEEEGEEEPCIFAKQFEGYLKTACQDALHNPTHVALNECYLEMFKKYMEWRTVVPKNHRNRIGDRGHRCLWHVLEAQFQKLRLVELSLPSPRLYLPAALLPALAQIPPPPLFPDICIDEPQ